jgi:hypothetical protein
MISYIEFLADVPIPQYGGVMSRRFSIHNGWSISITERSVRLQHASYKYVAVVQGVPYIVFSSDETVTNSTNSAPSPAPITVNTKKGKSK